MPAKDPNVKKIVLIGAGSAMFTQGLVADLIAAATGEGRLGRYRWDLCLVDIDEEALEVARAMAEHVVNIQNAEASISLAWSTDRRDVLHGADVVVSTIAVGKRRAWEADVFIPRKYGIFQPVGDTAMPGGISRAMRMIPATVAIARDIAALCPEALFINYANPMTANCWAVHKATGVPVIGLCHGVNHIEGFMASQAGLDRRRTSSLAVGVNHLTWMTEFRHEGADAWPLVRAKADRTGEPFSWGLFDAYGAYPCVSDRHVTEFFPERFPEGRYYGRILGVDAFSFEDCIAGGDTIYARMGRQARGEEAFDDKQIIQRAEGEHEQLLEILDAHWADSRRVFSMNVPNLGAVANLPADAVLEIPVAACAGSGGFRPLSVPDFPDILASIIARKLTAIRLTVEAALKGDRLLFVEALLADGAVTYPLTAGRLADELLAAHKEDLPQF